MGKLYQIEEVALDADGHMVTGSLGDRIRQLYDHAGTYSQWYGVAGTPSGTHKADRVGVTDLPLQMDAGNDAWGTWLQILGSADTPHIAGKTEYHLTKLVVTAVERNTQIHFIQIGFGASGADALTNETYSDLVFVPLLATGWETPLAMACGHEASGTLAWARAKVPGQDTGTVTFFFAIHENAG